MDHMSQRAYTSNSAWALDVNSERNHLSSERKENYSEDNRVRRKSDPATYNDPAIAERNKPSSITNKDKFKSDDRSRINAFKISETIQDVHDAFSYSSQKKSAKDLKSKVHPRSEHSTTSKKSLMQKAEVKHVENYVEQKYYQPKTGTSTDGQKLESIGKYATMQARPRKPSHGTMSGRRKREQASYVSSNRMKSKLEERNEKAIYHNPSRYSSEKSSLSYRPFPNYQGSTAPLQNKNVVDVVKTRMADNKKETDRDYVPVELIHQKRTRDRKNSPKRHDYLAQKPLVNEKSTEKNTEATETAHPILIYGNHEIKPKHRYLLGRKKDLPFQKQNVTYTGASQLDVRKSPDKHVSNVHVKGVNKNELPAYDGELLKRLLISHQRNTRNDSNESRSLKERDKGENSSPSKNATPRNQNNAYQYEQFRKAQITSLDADFENRTRTNPAKNVAFSNVAHEGEILQLLAEEEKYWKDKINKKGNPEKKDAHAKQEETRKTGIDKQERVKKILPELQVRDQKQKVDYSEITDTLRAEEEFLAQKAEKLLKQRFRENETKAMRPRLASRYDSIQHSNAGDRSKNASPVDYSSSGLDSSLITISEKSPSVTSSDDFNLKPEAEQAYQQNPSKKILRIRSPVYICSGCLLPVQRDICLYVAELQSYWHEKCFRCSVCHSSLIQSDKTPKIRVMYSRIHCENCLSSKKTGEQNIQITYNLTGEKGLQIVEDVHLGCI